MEIQWVLTFCKILLPLVSKKVASFYNSNSFLGLLANKNERITTNLLDTALWTKKKGFEWPNLYDAHNNALPPNMEPISLSFALTHQLCIQQT
jgi:hypothetical protein